MENLIISIIIPVYNTEKYLQECIDSVRQQSYKNLELIFINDGSTDNSSVILDRAAESDTRIKIVEQENSGLSAARNRGMREASGDYIMFLDSDDWLDKKTCEIALGKMKQYDADVVFWSYIREYREKSLKTPLFSDKEIIWQFNNIRSLFRRMVGLTGKELVEPQKTDSLITAWGKLYKKSVLNDINFVDTKIIGTEDALFNIQVFSQVQTAVYIPGYFSHYRKYNEISLTHQYKTKLAKQWKELYQRILQVLRTRKMDKECFSALNNRICLGLIGLGLNLVEDNKMNFNEKIDELHRILDMQHYKKALAAFSVRELPIYWKVFFVCAKLRLARSLYLILLVMNWMRSRV